MMRLEIKRELMGLVVTRSVPCFPGSITFDTCRTRPEHYINFYNMGFSDMFDVTL